MDPEFYHEPQLQAAVTVSGNGRRGSGDRSVKTATIWLLWGNLCILFFCGGAVAQAGKEVDSIVTGVNRYQERARKQVQVLKVVQLVVQKSGDEERKEQATVVYRPPSEVKREVEWSNIGHPSNGFPLKHMIGFPLRETEYKVLLVGAETVRGHDTFKLQIKPVAGDEKRIDGFLWVSKSDYGPVQVEGDMTNTPFPIKSLKMFWAYEPGPSGLWMLKEDSTSAVAKIVFKTIRGQSVASYDRYEVNVSVADRGP